MYGLTKLKKTNTDKNINREAFLSIQIEDKALRTQVSKGFSLCKVV